MLIQAVLLRLLTVCIVGSMIQEEGISNFVATLSLFVFGWINDIQLVILVGIFGGNHIRNITLEPGDFIAWRWYTIRSNLYEISLSPPQCTISRMARKAGRSFDSWANIFHWRVLLLNLEIALEERSSFKQLVTKVSNAKKQIAFYWYLSSSECCRILP